MRNALNDKPVSQQRSALLQAIASEDIERVRSLINEGADVNACSRWDFVKAIEVASREYPEGTAQFIEHYCKTHADCFEISILVDRNEYTEHPSVLDLFLSLEADVDKDSLGSDYFTPLMLACALTEPDIVTLLIDAGADVNALNWHGRTALMIAADAGNTSAVKSLIDRWANLDAHDDLENTALIHAAVRGYEDVVRLLLSAGASPHIENIQDCTAGYFAYKYGHLEIAKIIEEYEKGTISPSSSRNSQRT